ncbi:MAG: T9SS type A sorting domain-containing protein, partial [Candidatus Cloacimonadales bacterium]
LTLSNYPNPFNPETTISFNNPQTGKVSLSIYNIKGQLVKSLLDDEAIAGPHSVVWNGKDNRGKSVASGIYFAKIKTGTSTQTKKMLLMK